MKKHIILGILFILTLTGWNAYSQCPTNIGFESGNLSYWSYNSGRYTGSVIYEGDYSTSPTISLNPIPAKLSTLTSSNDRANRATGFNIITADNTNSATDAVITSLKKVPIINGYRYTKSVQLGNSFTGAVADKLTYRFTVPTGLSSYNITYAFAMILQDPGHPANQQPAFVATVLDLSQPAGQQKIECASKAYNASTPGLLTSGGIKYSNWQEVSFDLSQYGGKQIEINFQALDCSASGHYGYAYLALRSENCSSGFVSGQSVICNNSGTLTYTTPAIDGATFNWTLPSGWTGTSTTNSITVTPNATSGTISVTPSQSCGNISTNSLSVTVAGSAPGTPGPITGTSSVCANGSAGSSNLSYSVDAVADATEYVWTLPTGWTIVDGYGTRSIKVNVASNAVSGDISVVAKNACGSSASSTQPLTVVASQPSVGGSISPSSVALSCPANNTLTLSGSTGTVTKWETSTNGGISWSEVSSSSGLSSITASPTSSALYRVVLTNGSCPSAVSSNALINVKSPPNIVTQPLNRFVCSGTATTFSVVASGDDLIYQWYVSTDGGNNFSAITNGGVYSGATTATLSLSSGINNTYDGYKYRVVVTNSCDNVGVTSNTVGLSIYASASVSITSQPTSVTVTQGSSTTLSVTAAGPGLFYQWQSSTDNVNFSNVSGATSSTYRPSTSTTGTYYFRVVVTSTACSGSASETSNVATLSVIVYSQNANQNPVAVNDNFQSDGYAAVTGNVLINDSDTETPNNALVVSQFTVNGVSGTFAAGQTATIPNVGTLVINANGTFVFTPDRIFSGNAPAITYTVVDTDNGSATAILAINLRGDLDGDGTPDHLDSAPNDGCIWNPAQRTIPTSSAWNNSDCDGDGVINLTEQNDGTNLNNGCDFKFSSRTLTPSNSWKDGDCDNDGISNFMECNLSNVLLDTDSDGVPNFLDGDSDNDGIPDAIEKNRDSDGDGWADYQDLDSDNDGIPDATEKGASGLTPVDTDKDGTPDYLDLDSDGDSLLDVWELLDVFDYNRDSNYNGRADIKGVFTDANRNGWIDNLEGYRLADTDGDKIPDYLDLDSDNDCIPDRVEGGLDFDKDNRPQWRDTDSDNDGIPDSVEAGSCNFPFDTDKDGSPDYLDLDSDNDGIPDSVEKGADGNNPVDTDKDGTPDFRDLDSDNDGMLDSLEKGADGNNPVDTDKDGTPDYQDLDSDNDGIPDTIEKGADGNNPVDTDKDGTPDYRDLDSDNDGIPDSVEKGADGNNPVDTDKDGTPDYQDLDSDNDGIPDSEEKGADGNNPVDTDKDGTPDYLDLDSDNDGIPDTIEKGADGNNPVDTDKDGTPDYRDLDSDNDGIPDTIEKGADGNNPVDTDKDGTPDYRDLDSDNDGIPDTIEKGADGNNPVDTDKDGTPDYRDLDSDNDGIPDTIEKGANGNNPVDTDKDGTPDFQDLDSDNDSIPDALERGADGNNPVDTDKDGTPDYRDLDSDNDGIPDSVEKGADGNNPVDTDKDGTPDYRDLDSDNDGIPDSVEKGSNGNNPVDTDRDGTPDFQDLDSDNDSIPDAIERGADGNNPVDTDRDGTPDYRDLDSDNDGFSDKEEAGPNGASPRDSDGDGVGDFRETDADGDGVLDNQEDSLDYGALPDCDGDGIPNRLDKDSCPTFLPQGISPNGDGRNDKLVIPGALRYTTRLSVYNRWGALVYEEANYKNNWGGETNAGQKLVEDDGLLPDGTYYYIVDFGGAKPTAGTYIYVNRQAN